MVATVCTRYLHSSVVICHFSFHDVDLYLTAISLGCIIEDSRSMLSPQALRCRCHCHFSTVVTLFGPKFSLTPPEAVPPTNRGDGQNFSCIQNVSQHGLNATPPCTHQCNRSMLGSQKLSRNTMAMLKGMQSHSFRFILSLRLWSNAIVILKPMENVHRGLLVGRRRPPSSHPHTLFSPL